MADSKYVTIQQHPNMRAPGDWQQMKSFVVQLEEILDDIYKRFGRLRFEDFGTKLQQKIEDDEGNIASLTVTSQAIIGQVENIGGDVSILQQTASQISSTVTNAVGDISVLQQTAAGLTSRVETAEGNITAINQRADGIEAVASKKVRTYSQASAPTGSSSDPLITGDLWIDTDDNNRLYRYNGSSWTVAEFSDPNKYTVQSLIAIKPEGIEIGASRYLKIMSGGTIDVNATNFKIDSVNKKVEAGNWRFDENGLNGTTMVGSKDIQFTVGESSRVANYWLKMSAATPADVGTYRGVFGMAISMFEPINGSTAMHFDTCLANNGTEQQPHYVKGNFFYSDAGASTLGTPTYPWSIYGATVRTKALGIYDNNYAAYPIIDLGQASASFSVPIYYTQLIQTSSRSVKDDIEKLPETGETLDRLEPVSFVYKNDPNKRKRLGLIYEDTVDVVPEICIDDGMNKAINYVELVPMLLKEIQSLRKRVAELEAKVNV